MLRPLVCCGVLIIACITGCTSDTPKFETVEPTKDEPAENKTVGRLEAISLVEGESGFVTFRNKRGGLSSPVDDNVRLNDRIESVYLATSELKEETLRALPALQEATELSLNSSAFADRHVDSLKPLVNLTSIQLNGTAITDDGLRRLLKGRSLTLLTLNDTDITDSAIESLASMESLEKLHMHGTFLSDAAVETLKLQLPDCKIYFSRREPGRERLPFVAGRYKPRRKFDPSAPVVTLGPIASLSLDEAPEVTESEIKHIQSLIEKLAEIDRPDIGLSPTMTGSAFLPIRGRATFGMGLIADHQISSSEALRELVSLGPKAMPFLLKALDDKTPTKVTTEGALGSLFFERELWGNPVSKAERNVLHKREKNERGLASNEPRIRVHTITVGDVCFVAIGQIVGRSYLAVRYQPTACIYINSPTHDPKFCSEVREIWSSDDARRTLFESLLQDYSTQGIFNGESLDGWYVGSHLQTEAALRLLFYFPDISAPLIAERLNSLKVHATSRDDNDPKSFIKREVDNGVRTEDFIEAVIWSKHPVITKAISEIESRTDDPSIRQLIHKSRFPAEKPQREPPTS